LQEKTELSLFREISLNLIDPPPVADRLEINDEAVKELSASIQQVGLLQPVLLAEKDGRYEIVFGHRRFLACQKLGRSTISAKIADHTPQQIAILRATENIQREDLTPVEEASAYARLTGELGMSNNEVAKLTGKSTGVIHRRMTLLRMPECLQTALHARQISVAVAEELNACTDTGYLEYLCEMAVDHGVTRMVAKQWVQDHAKSLRTGQQDVGGGGGLPANLGSQKIYTACETCEQAVDISEAKMLRICPECWKTIISNLGPA